MVDRKGVDFSRARDGSARRSRYLRSSIVAIGVAVYGGVAAIPARADDADTQAKIQQLESQVKQLQTWIETIKQQQAQQQAQPQAAPLPANAKTATPYETPSHQFGLESADGQNSIELTGRLHLDAGDYLHYAHGAGVAGPHNLDSGFNARRARLGVTGKFAGDFNYTLVYDFGGSSDSTSPLISGSAASGIENAYITYNGFNKPDAMVPIAIDVGYLDVPWTMDEATSSNDIMFMERSSSQVVATEFGGGDFRSAAGIRSYRRNYWAGAYISGPTSGTAHSSTPASISGTTPATTSQSGESLAYLGRFAYEPLNTPDYSLHVGVNGAHMENTGFATTTAAGAGSFAAPAQSLTLNDRPELRVDPTALLSSTITNVNDANVIGGELAGAYEHAYFQGEYYHYMIDRFGAAATHPNLAFDGGYVEASYSIGGKRSYVPTTGAYSTVIPDHNLSLAQGGGWGALEFALRFSEINLNDKGSFAGGSEGGNQTVYGVGVNYYPNLNVKFMFDYLHAQIDKSTVAGVNSGYADDSIAGRFQFTF